MHKRVRHIETSDGSANRFYRTVFLSVIAFVLVLGWLFFVPANDGQIYARSIEELATFQDSSGDQVFRAAYVDESDEIPINIREYLSAASERGEIPLRWISEKSPAPRRQMGRVSFIEGGGFDAEFHDLQKSYMFARLAISTSGSFYGDDHELYFIRWFGNWHFYRKDSHLSYLL